jgi:hypothetical protein
MFRIPQFPASSELPKSIGALGTRLAVYRVTKETRPEEQRMKNAQKARDLIRTLDAEAPKFWFVCLIIGGAQEQNAIVDANDKDRLRLLERLLGQVAKPSE